MCAVFVAVSYIGKATKTFIDLKHEMSTPRLRQIGLVAVEEEAQLREELLRGRFDKSVSVGIRGKYKSSSNISLQL
jgi:hypothetical protein